MTNYLELGAKTLHTRMQAYAGVDAVYRRGNTSINIKPVAARVVTDQAVESLVLREVTRDFIVRRTDLAELDPPTPQRNDEIHQTIDGERWVFKVNGDGNFTSHYEEADSYGIAWRVHTKRDRHA